MKRVVGLPGERWSETAGFVFIERTLLAEPYVETQRRDSETFPEHAIPQDSYFVLGDNRAMSCDSRRWGYVPKENIIGRVVAIDRGSRRIKVG